MSAAAMRVGAGAFSEPADTPGLAHFLEHLLFLGTKKYPSPYLFSSFISSNSGRMNGMTNEERTKYFFEIPSVQFDQALDIFSHFFIDPLLSEESVYKEVNAVTSEYEKSLQIEDSRSHFLLRIISNTSSLFSRFTCGNYETLTLMLEKYLSRFHNV